MNEEETVFEWCKRNKEAILKAFDEGDPTANTIVRTHDMFIRFPERIALTLLECAVEEWKEREANATRSRD